MDPRQLGESLGPLVDRLVESYLADPRTQYIDREHLPAKAAAVRICDLLLELTNPGFVGRRHLTRHNISYHVGELIPRLWEQLADSITQCLCHESDARDAPDDAGEACRKNAAALATSFVEKMPAVRALLALDAQAHYDGDPAAHNMAEVLLAYPGMLAITIHRYAHELYRLDVPMLPRMMSEHVHILTGIDIHPGASIGRSFCIDHGTGVVIGETTSIGENVKIYQGVTLGALSFAKDERGRLIRGYKRHPTVESNVTIYANAIVLGGETTIGEGAVVGGSVFLTKSVAAGHQITLAAPVLRVRPPKKTSPRTASQDQDYVI